jgi:hypothetical protein
VESSKEELGLTILRWPSVLFVPIGPTPGAVRTPFVSILDPSAGLAGSCPPQRDEVDVCRIWRVIQHGPVGSIQNQP